MTAERPAGDLGRKLREARERKGVSLRQIANSTKIEALVVYNLWARQHTSTSYPQQAFVLNEIYTRLGALAERAIAFSPACLRYPTAFGPNLPRTA